MSRFSSLLFGLGIGAGMMYYFDPNSGVRRRTAVKDQITSLQKKSDAALEAGMKDLRNRVQGTLAEAMAYVSTEPTADWILQERVRSKLGTLTRHSSAVVVDVHDKKAYLSGDVLAGEVEKVVTGVMAVRGVSGVENHLNVHQGAENIPALQGAAQVQSVGNGKAWSPSTRLLAGIGGGILAMYGTARGGFIGRLVSITGWGLAIRSATNLELRGILGMTEERKIIRIQKTIQIPAPVDRVYAFWSNYTNFPNFMSHIREVKDMGEGRSHWVVAGPVGVPIEWDAVTTKNVPNEVIAWESVPGAMVKSMGEVHFRRENDNTTQVHIKMFYNPPAGAVGHAIASLFGADPKSAMDDDLMLMKSMLTDGKAEGETRRRASRSEGSGDEMSAGGTTPATGEA